MAGDERIVAVYSRQSVVIIFDGGFQLREVAVRVDGGEGFVNSGACPSGDIGDIVEVGAGTVYRVGGDAGGRGGGVTSLRQQDLGAGVVAGKGNAIFNTIILSDDTTGQFRRDVSGSFHAAGI